MKNQNIPKEYRRTYYENFIARVTESNAAFDAASPSEKRVIIARDVLAHLQGGVLIPAHCYVGMVRAEGASDGSSRDWIAEQGSLCRACARASIVFATIMRHADIEGSVVDGDSWVEEFPKTMMMEIEAVYERDMLFASWSTDHARELINTWSSRLVDWARLKRARDFSASRLPDWTSSDEIMDTYSLTVIMRWIIDHEGEFGLIEFLEDNVAKLATLAESIRHELKQADTLSEDNK